MALYSPSQFFENVSHLFPSDTRFASSLLNGCYDIQLHKIELDFCMVFCSAFWSYYRIMFVALSSSVRYYF